jgi:hypothetical protein
VIRVEDSSNRTKTSGATMPAKATRYLFAVAAGTTAAIVASLAGFGADGHDLRTFAILTACAAMAQVFLFETGRNHGFATAIMFLTAAALLLPPELVALMGIGQHLPELVARRYPWYIETFNISNYTLSALAASSAAHLAGDPSAGAGHATWAAAGLAACVTLVAVNHVLLAGMLRLARGHSFNASGLFSTESLSIDLVLALLGVALASFSHSNPYLMLAALAPLVLIHRLLKLRASFEAVPATRRA